MSMPMVASMLQNVNFGKPFSTQADTRVMRNTWFHIKRFGLVLGLVGLLGCPPPYLLAASSPTSSHYLENALIDGRLVQRWNDSTTVIHVAIQPAPKLQGWSPKLIDLVKSSFSEWQQAMGGRVRFVYTISPTATDILVRWQQRSNGVEVGRQTYSWDGTNTLINTDIDIALMDPTGQFHSDTEIRSIALHEIGHALGIKGHSNNPHDIMYPSLQPQTTRLSARDVATLKVLYQRKPDITNPVGVHFLQYQQFLYYARLGAQALEERKNLTAYQYFLKAQSYYPNDSRIPYLVGVSAFYVNKYDVAIQHLEKAVTAGGKDKAHAEFFLASALMASGADEISAGKETSGLRKLHRAKSHYGSVIKNASLPQEMRKIASSNLSVINNAMSQ